MSKHAGNCSPSNTNKLRGRNLNINVSKEYVILRNGDVEWKMYKLLGSLLDTAEDIKRHKGFTIAAIKAKKDIFYSNMDVIMKMRAFNVYVDSIFLYNCELWDWQTLNVFHWRLLRTAVLSMSEMCEKLSNKIFEEKTLQV